MRQNVNGTVLLGVKILVGIDIRFGVKPVLFAQPRDQFGGGVLAELPIADALDGDRVQIAADGRAVTAGTCGGCCRRPHASRAHDGYADRSVNSILASIRSHGRYGYIRFYLFFPPDALTTI